MSSLITPRHPKKQPVANIRRFQGENIFGKAEKIVTNLSIDERHRQRREGAGEFLDGNLWKK